MMPNPFLSHKTYLLLFLNIFPPLIQHKNTPAADGPCTFCPPFQQHLHFLS